MTAIIVFTEDEIDRLKKDLPVETTCYGNHFIFQSERGYWNKEIDKIMED